ncbi:MAG: hypothetical protein EOO52_08600 [Gammaproteobacteria bacterium]|nr:MAG: hypothetical protein EOO52_08600 [Gammaproteobacteria bacterium]
MQLDKIFVVGTGVTNPLGQTAEMVARFVNASLSAVHETDALNKRLKPIKMALVPEKVLEPLNSELLPIGLSSRQERLVRLANSALVQLKPLILPESILPLVLALPESIPNKSRAWKGSAIEQFTLQSGIKFDVQNSLAAEIGRAGGLHAIKHVFKLMEAGHNTVLLGGVDTYLDAELLAHLDNEDRLLVEGAHDGFQPGEGACFVLLSREDFSPQSTNPRIVIYRPGNSEEPGHRYSDQPYRGDGLANAVRAAITNAPATIDSVWTSMIYDNFCNKEFGVTLTRNSLHFSPAVKFKHPVDCFGDLGAAIGSTLIALIAGSITHNNSIGRHHLLCCSSDTAYRSAVRLDIE